MFPNWIWYILGKKSSGDSPTPPEPPTPVEVPVVFPNGIKFSNSSWATLPDFIKNGDFSEITDTSNMFYSNANLTEFSISEDTANSTKNSTSFYNMFAYCRQLKKVDWLDTSNSTTFQGMFNECSNLEDDIPLFDTSKGTNFYNMFTNCRKITKIPQFDTSSAENLAWSFTYCAALTDFPLLNTSNVTSFANMFLSVNNLSDTSLDNILQMCINATRYSGTKSLSALSLTSNYDSRIVNLPHYQDFLDARLDY